MIVGESPLRTTPTKLLFLEEGETSPCFSEAHIFFNFQAENFFFTFTFCTRRSEVHAGCELLQFTDSMGLQHSGVCPLGPQQVPVGFPQCAPDECPSPVCQKQCLVLGMQWQTLQFRYTALMLPGGLVTSDVRIMCLVPFPSP